MRIDKSIAVVCCTMITITVVAIFCCGLNVATGLIMGAGIGAVLVFAHVAVFVAIVLIAEELAHRATIKRIGIVLTLIFAILGVLMGSAIKVPWQLLIWSIGFTAPIVRSSYGLFKDKYEWQGEKGRWLGIATIAGLLYWLYIFSCWPWLVYTLGIAN